MARIDCACAKEVEIAWSAIFPWKNGTFRGNGERTTRAADHSGPDIPVKLRYFKGGPVYHYRPAVLKKYTETGIGLPLEFGLEPAGVSRTLRDRLRPDH
jgi:hypothetical protein